MASLDHEVVAETGAACQVEHLSVGRPSPMTLGTLGTPASFASRGLDLGAEPMPQLSGERHLEAELRCQGLRLLVEHQERDLAPGTRPRT